MTSRRFWIWLGFALFAMTLLGQDQLVLDSQQISEKGQLLSENQDWRLWLGPRADGSDPHLNDDDWLVSGSILSPTDLERVGWAGHGWFRLRLSVPPALQGRYVTFKLAQRGASEIYLNGELIHQMGRVSDHPEAEISQFSSKPFLVRLGQVQEQLLAVHFSGFTANPTEAIPRNKGFFLIVRAVYPAMDSWWANRNGVIAYLAFFLGFFCVFAIFHGLLFHYYPEHLSNLFVALIGVAGVGVLVIGILQLNAQTFKQIDLLNHIQQVITLATLPLLLHYCYSAFYHRIPKSIWIWYLLIPIGYSFYFFGLSRVADVLQMIALFEIARQTMKALWQRKPGAWTLGLGILAVVSTVSFEILGMAGALRQIFHIRVGLPFFGAFILMLLISTHVSRVFAKTNKQLAKELERVRQLSEEKLHKEREARALEVSQRVLEADNARKTQELEQARQLQLSMLPKELPVHTHFEVAAFMGTATEVGGDFYDFHAAENGPLTVAIGDATGHGTKAGTMVAAVKGLFSVLANDTDLIKILRSINTGLRRMHMRNMFMALALLKIEGARIRYVVAGMPAFFVWRAETRLVEVSQMKGLPLGGVGQYPYREASLQMHPGDQLVLMSDGLSEMFNSQRNMLGDERVKRAIAEAADGSPDVLIQALIVAGERWRGDCDQDDDVTFVVLKAKTMTGDRSGFTE